MKKKYIFFEILIILFFSIVLYGSPSEFNNYFIKAAKIAKPSVVNIIIYKRRGETLKKVAYGSGTIISNSGYVVTNNHVLNMGNFYRVISAENISYSVEKLTENKFFLSDSKTDIALIKIKNPGDEIQAIEFSNSNQLLEGEWVLAIGNPYGLKQSITSGIISSVGRDNIGFTDIEDFIQSDVAINPGNSGGPLINLYGKMVGLNTAIRTDSGGFQGISFSIPSNIVKKICYDLIDYGRVRRGWLGFFAKEKLSNQYGKGKQVVIVSVIKKSPAHRVGLRVGDKIKSIDGVIVNSLGLLVKTVSNKKIGSYIEIVVSRLGRLKKIRFRMREKSNDLKIRKRLQNLTRFYGFDVDEDSVYGSVVISYVSPKSIQFDFRKGDIILRINNIKVKNINDFSKVFLRDGARVNSLQVKRDNRILDIIVE